MNALYQSFPRDQQLPLLDQHMVLVGDLLQQLVLLPCFADRLTSAFMPKTAKGRKNQSTVSKFVSAIRSSAEESVLETAA